MRARLFMRADAVCDAVLAAFLLSATWDGLYDFLGLPFPRPELYAQLLGAALVGLAVLEWRIAGRPGQREVAAGVAMGSGLAAAVLVVWLALGRTGADGHGVAIFAFVAGFLALESVVHARTWFRRDAL